MSGITDESPNFQSCCDFSTKFTKQLSSLGRKKTPEKAELVYEIEKFADKIFPRLARGESPRNVRNIIGTQNVLEFKSKKVNRLRIYFTIQPDNRPLILLYGKKTTQKRDIAWLKKNYPA